MAVSAVRVENLDGLMRAFKMVSREEPKQLRKGIRDAAQPVKLAAEGKAVSSIRRMSRSPQWAVMRLGYARNLVYMVPKQKGVRGRGPRARRNFSQLLLNRAMIPAAEQNRAAVMLAVQRVLDTVGRQWERA